MNLSLVTIQQSNEFAIQVQFTVCSKTSEMSRQNNLLFNRPSNARMSFRWVI